MMVDAKVIHEPGEVSVHRQERAVQTRDRLLRSARSVFARDGFEQARIEDIATLSGKSRGAFYANFADKEDVFYAIFEDNIARDLEHLGPTLSVLPTTQQRVEALAVYLVTLSNDRERMLLSLEFKLYAIRHDRHRQRLAQLYTCMCLRCSIPELTRLVPQLGTGGECSEAIDAFAICGILDGLALNHLFNPELLGEQELARYFTLCLSGLTSTSTLLHRAADGNNTHVAYGNEADAV